MRRDRLPRDRLAALALLALVLVVFQYLIRELLRSQRRAEELAALQLGVLASMVETLALRDRMTARHSAAVARYARALAEAHGCARDQQDLVHTAGLLHDIGKFSFPDAILLAEQPLSEEDWRIVRRHPEEGARVRRADGGLRRRWRTSSSATTSAGTARATRTGLPGRTSRCCRAMVMIADAYDVMIARDSYRRRCTSSEAVAEMRRVAGTQFDPELVDDVRRAARRPGLRFRHADDADFEAELDFERRVRKYARRARGRSRRPLTPSSWSWASSTRQRDDRGGPLDRAAGVDRPREPQELGVRPRRAATPDSVASPRGKPRLPGRRELVPDLLGDHVAVGPRRRPSRPAAARAASDAGSELVLAALAGEDRPDAPDRRVVRPVSVAVGRAAEVPVAAVLLLAVAVEVEAVPEAAVGRVDAELLVDDAAAC